MPELVRLEHYGFTYPQQTRPALSDVELTIREGEFWVLCGTSGCGKTTLLRQLKPSLRPHGAVQGCVWFDGQPLEQLPPRRQAADIGFVLQSPEEQTVTDKVWHELAFGLESLGYDTPAIRRRVAEMASFFGIQDWFHRRVDELSGGQKQLLALASVMVMQPRLLILDEPTSQLDPIAAADFLQTVGRLNRELGVTVLLTEHRLEEALPLATHAAVLDGGRLLCAGAPEEVCRALRGQGHDMFLAMPAAVRIWASVDADAPCPITVREGRDFLTDWCGSHPLRPLPPEPAYPAGEPVLTGEGLWFRYDGQAEDVVRGLDIQLRRGELLALLGGNGAGKSTTLNTVAGLLHSRTGSVRFMGEELRHVPSHKLVGRGMALVPEGRRIFQHMTVQENLDMGGYCRSGDMSTDIESVFERFPRLKERRRQVAGTLSGGEQQMLAMGRALMSRPKLLMLDEPSMGLAPLLVEQIFDIIRQLHADGTTILLVEQNAQAALAVADRGYVLETGRVVTEGTGAELLESDTIRKAYLGG